MVVPHPAFFCQPSGAEGIESSVIRVAYPSFKGVCYGNRLELGHFLQPAPFGNTTYLGWIWSGFQVTVALSLCAWVIAFFVGSLFGILRTVPNRILSGIGACYVELFRNVPLIVQFLPGIWWFPNYCQ